MQDVRSISNYDPLLTLNAGLLTIPKKPNTLSNRKGSFFPVFCGFGEETAEQRQLRILKNEDAAKRLLGYRPSPPPPPFDIRQDVFWRYHNEKKRADE